MNILTFMRLVNSFALRECQTDDNDAQRTPVSKFYMNRAIGVIDPVIRLTGTYSAALITTFSDLYPMGGAVHYAIGATTRISGDAYRETLCTYDGYRLLKLLMGCYEHALKIHRAQQEYRFIVPRQV